VKQFLCLLLLVPVIGCNESATLAPAAGSSSKREVTLDIVDYAGIQARIASHPGKVVVVDGWSTSCEPCLKEFPNLVALNRKHAGRVACISLSFDYEGLGKPEEQREKVLEFLRSQNATFENLLSSEASDDLFAKFKLPSIPAVFVYDQQGMLAKRFDSTSDGGKGFSYRDVEAKVAELLGKN
jgi:thiol-disulfide isomerase/thioredoxin